MLMCFKKHTMPQYRACRQESCADYVFLSKNTHTAMKITLASENVVWAMSISPFVVVVLGSKPSIGPPTTTCIDMSELVTRPRTADYCVALSLLHDCVCLPEALNATHHPVYPSEHVSPGNTRTGAFSLLCASVPLYTGAVHGRTMGRPSPRLLHRPQHLPRRVSTSLPTAS